jgi:phage-related minor tail protein
MPSNPAFRGAKANGGPVMAGGSYLVGERGPELFTPRSSGTITANEKLGGSTVNNMITVNVDASGSTVEGNEGQANSFGQALGAAIQAELIAQKRAGGLLSNA